MQIGSKPSASATEPKEQAECFSSCFSKGKTLEFAQEISEGPDSRMLRRSTAGCSYGVMLLWLAGVLILATAEAQAMSRTVHLMCKHAYDRKLCLTSLAAHPEAATSGPRGLATIGIHNAIGEVSSFYSYTGSMRSTSDGGGEDSALAVCQSTLLDAQNYMQLSIDTLGALSQLRFKEQMADALTWLSSALTDHTTCLDGVSEKAGGAKGDLINTRAGTVTTMLSNAVSLVAAISSFGMNDDHSRRRSLLADRLVYELDMDDVEDEFPAWMRAGGRKLMQSATNNLTIVNAVVAKDGSGQYQSIQAAIDAAPKDNAKKWVIGVKEGVYSEYVVVPKSAKNLVLFGDGSGKTIITGDKSVVGSNVTTFATATMAVLAPNFLGRDFTVRNTAGAINHQAVALKVQGDKSAFWRCSFEGYQDTLYAHSNRQFFKDCTISGTVDFIFGNAAAVFQSCTLLGRLPLSEQQNTFTAQGRTTSSQNTGLSFQNCIVDAAPELKNAGSSQVVMSYLGRPWKEFSRTVFLTCAVTDVIAPQGWLPWNGDFALATLFYGEYENAGAGAATAGRVAWATQIGDATVANQFTVNPFLTGADWLPQTSIDYSAALYSN